MLVELADDGAGLLERWLDWIRGPMFVANALPILKPPVGTEFVCQFGKNHLTDVPLFLLLSPVVVVVVFVVGVIKLMRRWVWQLTEKVHRENSPDCANSLSKSRENLLLLQLSEWSSTNSLSGSTEETHH